jgi:uncharacterized protein
MAMKNGVALILSIGIFAAATVFGMFFLRARTPEHTISVVGSAGKQFDTDIVKWRLTVSRNASLSNIAESYKLLNEDISRLTAELTTIGIESDGIEIQPISTNQVFNPQNGEITGYTTNQSLVIISQKIPEVESLALNPGGLVSKGIILQFSALEYFSTKVEELKHELLSAASEDARIRAEEIARSTGSKVGTITAARAGVFQITEPYSTEVSDFGIYNTTSRHKEIKVTVHATFSLH